MAFGELTGQGWTQLEELGLAFLLSALIGIEREIRHKSAGLRTYTVVGFAAALIMLVSKYGFGDVLINNRVVLDPSRIAAQIVSGIGFIGGGLIFVRRDSVRGLTTAAIVWLTAAVGMACGAGLPILAIAVTAGHFIIVFVFPQIALRLPKSRWAPSLLEVSYEDQRDILRDVLVTCTKHDFSVTHLQVERASAAARGPAGHLTDLAGAGLDESRPPPMSADQSASRPVVTVLLEVVGTGSISKLAARLADIDGVASVRAGDVNEHTE